MSFYVEAGTGTSERWGVTAMLFVDGENLCIRAQDHAAKTGDSLPGHHMENIYYWPIHAWPSSFFVRRSGLYSAPRSAHLPIRAVARTFYFTAVQGDELRVTKVEQELQEAGFSTPRVFKKRKGKKSKQVDIQLSVDMLSNAYMNNYDVAILVTGDKDYIPLVQEVQRLGKPVYLSFIESGLSTALKLTCDAFAPFEL